jgi:MFS family permease
MTFGQVLDRIYRLMRSNLKVFVGIAAVPGAATVLIFALAFAAAFAPILRQLPRQPDPRTFLWVMIPLLFFATVLNLAVFALYLAASVHAASQAHLGLQVTFRESYAVAWRRGWSYLWLLSLTYLIAFLPVLVIELAMVVPMALFASDKSNQDTVFLFMIPLGILLFIAAMVYGTIAALRLSLAFPASLAEGLPAWAAIRRSNQLTQGAKGRIFLVLLVVYALAYAAEMVGSVVLMVVFGVGALLMAVLQLQPDSLPAIVGIGLAAVCFAGFFFLWIALIWSAFSTAFAVLYHDQRLRKDGPLSVPVAAGEPA